MNGWLKDVLANATLIEEAKATMNDKAPNLTADGDGGGSGPTASEQALAAVGEALARPAVVNTAASRGLAARTQLEAQELDYQIAEVEHVIEHANAKLVDLLKTRSMQTALLREYHKQE